MKIQLLGTGAADGIPALFSDSAVSRAARENGGKDVRTRCAAILDDHIHIDFGPDTWCQAAKHGVRLADITAIVYTHSHDDHLARNELQYVLVPFTDLEYAPFTIYGNAEVLRKVDERYPLWPFELIETRSFEPFHHAGTKITPIKAYHKLDEDSQNLILQRDGRTILYGTDTGYWRDETWEFLAGWKIDALVIEATDGFARSDYYGHMDLAEAIASVKRLREMGVLPDSAPVVTTHHSHLGQATHAQLEEALSPHGMQAGYDGITIEIG